jgi:glycosyltransferase involved in cell wall biosynthesis
MAVPELSVVIPVYNEEEVLPALFARLSPAFDALGRTYEVLFVNDGSRDRSAALLREQFQERPDVTRVILFNGNFGQHMAIMAGFEHCRSQRVVTLDADLQNPPEAIGKLLAHGRGARLRGIDPTPAPGRRVAPLGVEGHEPLPRAHHAHPHDRPGMHAARLRPRHHRRDPRIARCEHLTLVQIALKADEPPGLW